MRKLSLTAIGLYISILAAFSQNGQDTAYKSKKLTLEEVNFVSGYYSQDGNHSAVTGGIGTEKLSDFSNTLELKLTKYDSRWRKQTYTFEAGIDHYTSASSDKINPFTISSASHADTRIYPSVGWTRQNEARGTTIGLTGSFSMEYDYTSVGVGALFSKTSKDNNREFSLKAQAYLDRWKVILPIEMRNVRNPYDDKEEQDYPSSPRNSYSASLGLSQVINRQLHVSLVTEPTYQSGLLATKYQRVYFTDGTLKVETLPDTRYKLPIGIRANYFLGDRFIVRSFYRLYRDNWGVTAHTFDLEMPVKITPLFSLSPFYRYYTQTAADYFAPYASHKITDKFFTSDYDLSKFNSQFFGAGFRIVPTDGLLGVKQISSAEIRAGHYQRSDGLSSNTLSLHLTFK